MKTKLLPSFFLLSLLFTLFACVEEGGPVDPPEPLPGFKPEAIIYVNGRPWFPATIGLMMNDIEGVAHLAANTSANKGYKKEFTVEVVDDEMDIPDNGYLDYWEVAYPIIANTVYREHTNSRNSNFNHWQSKWNDWAGMRIDSTYVIEGIKYATGEFFATPGNDSLQPIIHDITGLFHHVRVFESHSEMQQYFDRVTELELFED